MLDSGIAVSKTEAIMKRLIIITLALMLTLSLVASCSGDRKESGLTGVERPMDSDSAGNRKTGAFTSEPTSTSDSTSGLNASNRALPDGDSAGNGKTGASTTDPTPTTEPASDFNGTPQPANGFADNNNEELERILVGLWHNAPVVGSGFSERLFLGEEFDFVWFASQMDGMQRVRARSGSWKVTGGKLELYATEEIRWEGGLVLPAFESWGSDDVIVDAQTVFEMLPEPLLLVYDVSEISVDREVLNKRTVRIGGEVYWELYHPADRSEIVDDYEDLKPENEDDVFRGVVREGRYYHDGMEKWLEYYFADVGIEQLQTLKNTLDDDYYDYGEGVETEIQLYSTDENINMKDYVDRAISFGGEWFAAHTIHHRRNIVFAVNEIYDSGTLKTFGIPLRPALAERGTLCYFNGSNYPWSHYTWTEYEDGSGEYCLMILVDAETPDGGAIDALYLPGYGLPVIGRNRYNIYIEWANPENKEETIELMFEEQSGKMVIFANALKGVKSGQNRSEPVEMPVSVYKDDSGRDRYYVPLYAILNEIGGRVIINEFNTGEAYIFSGGE